MTRAKARSLDNRRDCTDVPRDGSFERRIPPLLVLCGSLAAVVCGTLVSPIRCASAADAPDTEATRQYAVALGFQKKLLYEQAAGRWTRFIQAYPKDERLDNANYHLGVCWFELKKWDEASKSFRHVLATFPQFKHRDGAQFNLSLAQYNLAQTSKKPEEFRQSAALFAEVPAKFAQSPYVPDALYYQAECLYQAGDREAAIPVYQKVAAAYADNPLQPDVHYALATAQQELEKYEDAAKTYQTFLTKFPKAPQVDECKLRLGLAQHKLKKYAEAEKLFAECAAVVGFAFADFALLQQAQSLFEQNKLPEAAVAYESLPVKFAMSPHLGTALLSAGKCRYRAGQFVEAQADLTKVATQKLPEAPEASYWLGRSLIQQKKPAEAVTALDLAIAAAPQSEFLPQLTFARIDALHDQDVRRPETVKLYADFAARFPQHALAADSVYRSSLTAFKLADYPTARTQADAFLANAAFAKHALLPDVLFLAGESALLAAMPDYAKSEAAWRRLVAEFPMHKDVSHAQLRIGYCLHAAKKYDESIALLNAAVAAFKDPAQVAEARLQIGRSQFDAKRIPDAVAAFRAAAAAKPDWDRGDEVLFELAAALRSQNDLPGATAELGNLNTRFPKSASRDRALAQLASIAFDQKQYDVAIKHYQQVLAELPKSTLVPSCQYGIASSLYEKEEDANAVAELTKLLTAFPQADVVGSALYLRGLSQHRLQKFAEAVQDFQKYLDGKPPEADRPAAQFALGLAQAGLKLYPQAAATFTALLQAKPDFKEADSVTYELAFAYSENKQEKEAAQTFEQLAAKYPESPLAPRAWFRIGEGHEKSEKLDDAEKAFATGLAKAKDAELRESLAYKLGGVQYAKKQYAVAAQSLDALLKEHPRGKLVTDAVWLSAESQYRQGKFDAALPLYQKVLATPAEKYHPRAFYRSGDCAANLKQWPQSQQFFQTLLDKHPKFEQRGEARFGVGFALQSQSQFEPARKAYEQVTKETDTETAAKARYMMGECSFAEKKYGEAVEHYLEAAIGYPYDEWRAMGHFAAGRCFVELKDAAKARESLETVVKKYPQHARAKDAAALLATLK